MIVFTPGKVLASGDLSLTVRDQNGVLFDPASITYSIFLNDPTSGQVLVLGPDLVPTRFETGIYWAAITIPSFWLGTYQLIWHLAQNPGDSPQSVYEDFIVEGMDLNKTSHEAPSVGIAQKQAMSQKAANLVMTVRELLSDTNPDRNYHFRPPTAGKTVAGYSQRVGFIWNDTTILRMINLNIAKLNTWNPLVLYSYNIESIPDSWAQAVTVGTAASCLTSEACRWAADEFSYSLNGVSLDLNKAQLYQSLAEAYKTEFQEWATPITATKPKSVGLRQNRWLLG